MVQYDGNNRDSWNNVKESFGFDFPNLPYMIDGETKLTQTNAILRYIATKKRRRSFWKEFA